MRAGILSADLRAGQAHCQRAPHENIVPLAEEIRRRGDWPEKTKWHDPHRRNDNIAAVADGGTCTGPDDGTTEQQAGQKPGDARLAHHLDVVVVRMRMAIIG